MLQALGAVGKWQDACVVRADMAAAGVPMNVVTWTSLIGACKKAGLVEKAFQLLEEMREDGLQPDTVTYNLLIDVCAEAGQQERAFALLEEMKLGTNGTYSKDGATTGRGPQNSSQRWPVAHEQGRKDQGEGGSQDKVDFHGEFVPSLDGDCCHVDSRLLQDDGSAAVSSTVRHSSTAGAFKDLGKQEPRSMVEAGKDNRTYGSQGCCAPDEATYNTLMKACASDVLRVRELMVEMRWMGITPSVRSWALLLDAHGTSGDLTGAFQVSDPYPTDSTHDRSWDKQRNGVKVAQLRKAVDDTSHSCAHSLLGVLVVGMALNFT